MHMMDVQIQVRGSDCGLFVIAFATAIVNGVNWEVYIQSSTDEAASIPMFAEW